MTTYPDLSPYSYLPASIRQGVSMQNVGWLGAGIPFETARPSEELVRALEMLCAEHQTARTRGWHTCDLGHDEASPPSPFMAEIAGRSIMLGSAEIRVVADDGAWLCAPDLVLHYVRDHHYAPPQVFVDAVVNRRFAPDVV